MILTSNAVPSDRKGFFTGDDTLLCTLDRIFDKASVFMMRGPSYRGRGLGTHSVESVPQATRLRIFSSHADDDVMAVGFPRSYGLQREGGGGPVRFLAERQG